MRDFSLIVDPKSNRVVAGTPRANFTVGIRVTVFAGPQMLIYHVKMLEFHVVHAKKKGRDVPIFFPKRSKMFDY